MTPPPPHTHTHTTRHAPLSFQEAAEEAKGPKSRFAGRSAVAGAAAKAAEDAAAAKTEALARAAAASRVEAASLAEDIVLDGAGGGTGGGGAGAGPLASQNATDPAQWLETDAATGETYLDMYWLDATEQNGVAYLFGKVPCPRGSSRQRLRVGSVCGGGGVRCWCSRGCGGQRGGGGGSSHVRRVLTARV